MCVFDGIEVVGNIIVKGSLGVTCGSGILIVEIFHLYMNTMLVMHVVLIFRRV